MIVAKLAIDSGLVSRIKSLLTNKVAEQSYLYDALLPYHKRMDGSVPNKSVVFIGDSMVQALVTSAIANHTVNYGIGGDTIGGLTNRIPLYESMDSARAIVISVGVNDG